MGSIEKGSKFNRWTIEDRVIGDDGKQVGWNCRCDCGVVKLIKNISTVKSGSSTSCGCLRKELLSHCNPMYDPQIAKKVSDAIKADPNRTEIIKNASAAAWTKEVAEKRKETNNERYGGNAPASSVDVKIKIRKSVNEVYGCDAPAQNEAVKAKMVATNMEKYGAENWMHIPENAEQVSRSLIEAKRNSSLKLSTGDSLVDYCRANNILATSARLVRAKYGDKIMEAWLNREFTGQSKLEEKAVDLLNSAGISASIYNKQVPEIAQHGHIYRPDIKIDHNNRVIFLDTDGLYFHSEKRKTDNKYHQNKFNAYAEQNMSLMQIRQDELYGHRADIVVGMIKSKLGLNNRIYARNTECKEVSSQEALGFLHENHLMGRPTNSKYIGLYENTCLLMVLAYSIKEGVLELVRIATKIGYTVTGGLSKLLNYLDVSNITSIISFVDCRYADGRSLTSIGFTLSGTTLGWQWTDGDVTYNRRAFTANPDTGETEREVADKAGVYKIYDAGQRKFVKRINQQPDIIQ